LTKVRVVFSWFIYGEDYFYMGGVILPNIGSGLFLKDKSPSPNV